MPEYAASILKLKEEYAGRLSIHLGAECEYFPDYLPWLQEQREALGLEYLILGVHYPPNEEGGPSSPRPPRRRSWNNIPTWPGGDGERAVRLPVSPGPAPEELSQI